MDIKNSQDNSFADSFLDLSNLNEELTKIIQKQTPPEKKEKDEISCNDTNYLLNDSNDDKNFIENIFLSKENKEVNNEKMDENIISSNNMKFINTPPKTVEERKSLPDVRSNYELMYEMMNQQQLNQFFNTYNSNSSYNVCNSYNMQNQQTQFYTYTPNFNFGISRGITSFPNNYSNSFNQNQSQYMQNREIQGFNQQFYAKDPVNYSINNPMHSHNYNSFNNLSTVMHLNSSYSNNSMMNMQFNSSNNVSKFSSNFNINNLSNQPYHGVNNQNSGNFNNNEIINMNKVNNTNFSPSSHQLNNFYYLQNNNISQQTNDIKKMETELSEYEAEIIKKFIQDINSEMRFKCIKANYNKNIPQNSNFLNQKYLNNLNFERIIPKLLSNFMELNKIKIVNQAIQLAIITGKDCSKVIIEYIKNNFVDVGNGKFTSKIIQNLIEARNMVFILSIEEKLLGSLPYLSFNLNGIHIVIKYMKQNRPSNYMIFKYLENNLMQISCNQHGSCMIQKIICLELNLKDEMVSNYFFNVNFHNLE